MHIHNLPTNRPTSAVIVSSNSVLRNTFTLLSLCLLFSAAVAMLSVKLQLPHPGILITLVGFYGLLFAIHKMRNSVYGLVLCFALTGFMGYTLGPILSLYLSLPNGSGVLSLAFFSTAATFVGMSLYGLTTRRDLSFMGGFLMAGMIVMLISIIANLFLQIPVLHLVISAVMVFLMSALIVYQTNTIVRGHETNYVLATVTLFVSIYNLFISFLSLFGGQFGE